MCGVPSSPSASRHALGTCAPAEPVHHRAAALHTRGGLSPHPTGLLLCRRGPLQSEALSRRGGAEALLLSERRIAEVAASLLSALAALHAAGLAHLDVHPGNVLMTAERRLLLADCGCCTPFGPDGLCAGAAQHTPLYTAPEAMPGGRAANARFLGPAADIFSFGITLAQCAAFHRMTGRALAFARRTGDLPDYVPEPLRDLATRLVDPDPAKRPTACEALAHPFLVAAGVGVRSLAPQRLCGMPPR
jgi:serine/threonine protein kinase